ncbi:MAG: hydroxyacid dehydrogenase [Mycobacteriales bacterium]
MSRPTTVLAMHPELPDRLFTPESRARLSAIAEIDQSVVVTDVHAPEWAGVLGPAEVLLTCWGVRPLDREVLDRAPGLRAVVHSAGSVKGFVTPELWDRGIVVSSCAAANALPVAEYTLAMILLAGKRVFEQSHRYVARRARTAPGEISGPLGNYGRRVGLIGASMVGRRVVELLRPFDVEVWMSDPFLSDAEAADLGVRPVSLDRLAAGCDIVSVHAPSLPSTRHLLDRRVLALLPDRATLINTARGALIDHDALTEELASGRIDAVIDTSDPEPLPAGSPLYDLPNVLLTPHVAGTQGLETHRLGKWAIDELHRYADGEAFRFPVTADDLARLA